MKEFTDQTGKILSLPGIPTRIISIVPSQTELLAVLGLEDKVIGITKFCVHPQKWFESKTRIGGTKALKIDLIRSMVPDLVLANKEENEKVQVLELERFVPVWTSNVSTITEAYDMILSVGEITGSVQLARDVVIRIKNSISRFLNKNPGLTNITSADKLNTAYAIWHNPLMVAGGDTFIHDMMKLCGFRNIFETKMRYPVTTFDELLDLNCELLLLSSEPFPFKEKHADEFRSALPRTYIKLVDGEMFSWYGSRLLYAPDYFDMLISELKSRKLSSGTN
jgi:ABC-type Fe3+-hydroxamate transport system substrate-binding protein